MSYWREREQRHIQQHILNDAQVERRLQQIQRQAMREIQQQINTFLARYAEKEGTSIAEVRKRISRLDMDIYSEKARRYVREKNFTPQANQEMRLYNLTMKTNRLELLKAHIWLDLVAAANDMERYMLAELKSDVLAEFERQSGMLGKTVETLRTERNAAMVVNASFLSATWSDRLWTNQDALRLKLDGLLRRAITQGIHSSVLAREVRDEFGVSMKQATRLMRTEKARVQTDVQRLSFEQSGYAEYVFIAEHDSCDVCKAMDDQVYKVASMQTGDNAPPMHPNCRCSTAAYMS
ncbi:minor capsid protein [Bacillus sp. FSL W7-1360]